MKVIIFYKNEFIYLLNTNYFIDTVKIGDDVQSYFRTFILQLRQKEWQQVFDGVVFAKDGAKAHYN